MAQLPDLGRNPYEAITVVSGCEVQGFDYVDISATDFTKGMIAKRGLDSSGNIQYGVYTGSTGQVLGGIFANHRTTSFYVPVYGKLYDFVSTTLTLKPYILSGSLILTSSTGATLSSASYTVNYTTGVVTSATYADYTNVHAYFRYVDPNKTGIDETLGSSKVTVITGQGEIATLVYDTGAAIAQGDTLKSNAGVPSTAANLSGSTIGTVTQPPTATNPYLRFRIDL